MPRAPSLEEYLDDLKSGDYRAKLAAVEGIGALGPSAKKAIPALIDLDLASRGPGQDRRKAEEIHTTVNEILADLGRSAVLKLTQTVREGDPERQALALRHLAEIGPPALGAVPTIEQVMRDLKTEAWGIPLRYEAAFALARISPDHPNLTKTLTLALQNPQCRLRALREFQHLGGRAKDSRVVERLIFFRNDRRSSPEVRLAAKEALDAITTANRRSKEKTPGEVNPDRARLAQLRTERRNRLIRDVERMDREQKGNQLKYSDQFMPKN